MMTKFAGRGILLDLDDTLYPERAYFESGLAAVGDWLAGADSADQGAWRRRLSADVERNGRSGVLDRIARPPGQSQNGWRAALLQIYRTHKPKLAAFADVDGFIEYARREGCKLGLVTDGKSCVQWRKLTSLGLDHRLDAVICSDDIDAAKPALEPFLAAAALLGLEPKACAYLADDAAKDFIGPNQLGMTTVQIRRDLPFPLAGPAPNDAAKAAAQVTSLTEAAELLFGES
jgi:putative hydrolase of the HAD superfamily